MITMPRKQRAVPNPPLDPTVALPKTRKISRRGFDPALDRDALRLWRVTKNITHPVWSQEYTARWFGVSLRMYRRWEGGQFPVPLYITNRILEHEAQLQEITELRALLRANNIAT